MKTSPKGISLIKELNECSLEAYIHPLGVWAIGYGHHKNVKRGDTITQGRAEIMFLEDLVIYEREINIQNLNLKQNQFDALVSLVYRIGGTAFRGSKLLRELKKDPNSQKIAPIWERINKNHNKVNQIKSAKNEAEIKLYTEQ